MSAERYMTTKETAALLTDPRVSEVDREAIRFFGCVSDVETTDGTPTGDARVAFWTEALEENGGPGWYVYCGEYPDEGAQRLESLKWDVDFKPTPAPPEPEPPPQEGR